MGVQRAQVLSQQKEHPQHCQSTMCGSHTQLCLTLRNPMDYSPPGCSVHGILQVRILEWVAISIKMFKKRDDEKPREGFEWRFK